MQPNGYGTMKWYCMRFYYYCYMIVRGVYYGF